MLEGENYSAFSACCGDDALELMDKKHIDLAVADVVMPHMDGYELTRILRENDENLPILIVSAKQLPSERQKGFLIGTDDCITKPIDAEEMLLRIKALLRRAKIVNDRRIAFSGITLEYDKLTVTRGGVSYELPQKEFMLLYKMVSFPGRIFTRQQLMDDIWGYSSETDTHTVDVHIGRLRERFRDNPDFKIVTMRGVGYKVVKL